MDIEEYGIFLLILADRDLYQVDLGEERVEKVIAFDDFLPHERHEPAVIHGMETDVGSILDGNDGIGRLDVEGHLFNHGNGNERHVDADDEDIFRIGILEGRCYSPQCLGAFIHVFYDEGIFQTVDVLENSLVVGYDHRRFVKDEIEQGVNRFNQCRPFKRSQGLVVSHTGIIAAS